MLRILILLLFITANFVQAYQSEIEIASINDEPLFSGEFLYSFNKNRTYGTPVTEDTLTHYLQQFINFKLKVKEAQSFGIDTSANFLSEYNSYINQIKKPYLQNQSLDEELIKEAYYRLQSELNVAHILVRIPKSPSPSDTLSAFNKIATLRKRAISGEDFGALAKKNSEDGSASVSGELGYFTAFAMVYPFETAAYETEIGAISEIVKTQFGYHIIKVLDKREARGRLKTAHVFISESNKSPIRANELIQQAYDSLLNGGDWRAICATFSEDTNSNLKGGSLPFYGVGQFPEPLLNEGFKLDSVGQFSAPVKSKFGWHILKLEAKEPIKPLNEIRSTLANNVKRSGRNQSDKDVLIKKLKNENGFDQNADLVNNLINSLGLSDSISTRPIGTVIFNIGSDPIYDNDFINYLIKSSQEQSISTNALWSLYKQFEYNELIKYEEALIPTKYPEHQYLINEYREGIMLFEIMENKVWNKAIEDSVGLIEYYENNRKNYPAKKRLEVYVIELESIDLKSKILALDVNSRTNTDVNSVLDENLSSQEMALLKIVKRRFEQDEIPILAKSSWKPRSFITDSTGSKIYWVDRIIPEGYFELNEIKGLVISDYQDALDQAWISRLRKNNKIKINKKAVSSLVVKLD